MTESRLLAELLLIAMAFALAAVPVGRGPVDGRQRHVRRLVPDVSNPSSMLSFVALPCFLILLTLARLGIYFEAVEPVNSPDSSRRLIQAPHGVDIDLLLQDGDRQLRYPRNTAERTAAAAVGVEASSSRERIRAIRDLAWWTAVCPNYAQFTIPRLAGALQDADPGVKGAAAVSLGSIGGYGAPALPDLLAARRSTVRYFDYLVDEALLLIQNTPKWPPAPECEDASVAELESRSRQTTR